MDDFLDFSDSEDDSESEGLFESWFDKESIPAAKKWDFDVFQFSKENNLFLVKFAGFVLGKMINNRFGVSLSLVTLINLRMTLNQDCYCVLTVDSLNINLIISKILEFDFLVMWVYSVDSTPTPKPLGPKGHLKEFIVSISSSRLGLNSKSFKKLNVVSFKSTISTNEIYFFSSKMFKAVTTNKSLIITQSMQPIYYKLSIML